MSASVISPDFQIRIFQPNTDKPLDFPMEYISSITSVRGLRGNSMTINFARDNKLNGLPYRAYFQDQSIVQLLVRRSPNEAFRQENLCYVSAVSSQGTPNKRSESITISGFETKLRNQNLFLDIAQGQDETVDQINSNFIKADGNNFVHTLSNIGEVFKNVKKLPDVFKAVYDTFIAELSNPHNGMKFGGKDLFKKFKTGQTDSFLIIPFAMRDGYTTTFIHIFNFISGYTIGASANFWDIITSLECEPLYELFFDTLESLPNEDTILDSITDAESETKYEVEGEKCSLIFRKTPFLYFTDGAGNWDRQLIKTYLSEEKIKSIHPSFSQDNVYTGVHVGLTYLGQTASTLIQPPTWNNNLQSHFGYKLLRIMLDGVTFEKPPTLGEIKSKYKDQILDIQAKMFKIFCGFPAFKAANVDIETQYDFFRPGTPLVFDNPETDFGDIGYIETVSSSFQAKGQASTQISLKWVDYQLKTDYSKKVKPVTGYSPDNLNQTQTA